MAKVKFPLEMANGVQVRTIEELKENFDVNKVLGYFLEGKLHTWLEDRYYDEEAEQVGGLKEEDTDLAKKLCEIFGIEYAETDNVDVDKIAADNQRIERIKQFTDDEDIIKNFEKVAFNQEELADLYDAGVDTIYLCEGEFKIPKSKQELKYIAFGGAKTNLNEKNEETYTLDTYSFEVKRNYILDETLSGSEINSEGKPYNLKVKAIYKINQKTREEILVTEERDNIDKFIFVAKDRVIYTVVGKSEIFMLSPSGEKTVICDEKEMKNIEFVYADDEKVLWNAKVNSYEDCFVAYYDEKYSVLLYGSDYIKHIFEFIKICGEWAWYKIGDALYAVNLKKKVKREPAFGTIGEIVTGVIGNNEKTKHFANRFLDDVRAMSSYENSIAAVSDGKIYLVDCTTLKKQILTECSNCVCNIIMNDDKIVYIDDYEPSHYGLGFLKLLSVAITTGETTELDRFKDPARNAVELYLVDDIIYYGMVNPLVGEYVWRYRITGEGVKEDASDAGVFKTKPRKR